MFKAASILLPLLTTVALLPSLACDLDPSTATVNQATVSGDQSPKSTEGVLATVNGTPIGEADVHFALSSGGHKKEIPPEHRKNVLETIIRRELIYQRAIEIGLDANPGYQEKLRRMEAQINAFKRNDLAKLF